MLWLHLNVLCGILVLVRGWGEEGKVVETTQGPVRGYLSDGGYFQFFGIPYATAPTGEHKFKAPLEPPTWIDVFEATNNKTVCPQPHVAFLLLSLDGFADENCLLINVFVPKTDKKSLPVIVYIHGGAYVMGEGNMVTHEALLKQEVIVVNFNYRLGAYGFLCLGTKDVPGNAGMKDQVAALRWVQRNIASFGGNPDAVTIAGYSAGSASVEHLMLSPMAKGLFTRAMAESGSAISAWATTPDPIAMAKRYMNDISGQYSDNIPEIEEFFKSLISDQLTEKNYLVEPDSNFGFVPCVEANIEGEESFYNESPLNILTKGVYNKVPFMTGFAREEGLFRMGNYKKWLEEMKENFADFLPQDLIFGDDTEKKMVAEEVKRFYFKGGVIDDDKLKEYVDFFTDTMFAYPVIRSARLHALHSVPVYLYNFAYVMSSLHSDKAKITGATHCAQTGTLNKFTFMGPTNYSQNDLLMQERLAIMWTNFAKFGVPVLETSQLLPVSWKPMEPERVNYLHMDLQFEAKERLLHERVRFWDTIYRQYYRKPVAPEMPKSSPLHLEL